MVCAPVENIFSGLVVALIVAIMIQPTLLVGLFGMMDV